MHKEQIDHLESIGEAAVLRLLSIGQFGQPGSIDRTAVEAWLELKRLERSLASSASAESMAAEHLRIARQQRTIAITAMLLSAITAIIVAFISANLPSSSSSPTKAQAPQASASAPVK